MNIKSHGTFRGSECPLPLPLIYQQFRGKKRWHQNSREVKSVMILPSS